MWRAKRFDYNTFKTARRETTSFILCVVEDTWIRELKDLDTFYTEVQPRDILDHLQSQCTGRHAMDILAFQDEMRQYHLEYEGIPEYINALEDAQRRAKRAGVNDEYVITDATLLLIASTAMLRTQQFPRVNDKWEDLSRTGKTWSRWKTMYKQAQAKARVKKLAAEGQDQFGGMAGAGQHPRGGTSSGGTVVSPPAGGILPVTAPPPPTAQELEGYFDNLAAAATNEKAVLDQLVSNNTKLAATNATLAAAVKSLQEEMKTVRLEVQGLKASSGGGGGGRGRGGNGNDTGTGEGFGTKRLCPNCKREVYHAPDDCFELAKNASRRPAGWRTRI